METTFCSSSERLGPGLGVAVVADGFGLGDFDGVDAFVDEGLGDAVALDVTVVWVVPVVPPASP